MPEVGKLLIVIGLVLVLVGILFTLSPRLPWLGRLPGDLIIKRDDLVIYVPVVTCIILSLLLSILTGFLKR
ncbi:MAG TPA: DUF2905 domain-containing protein [Candidatus Omnitrophota bacterium]|nr:DUF2905 domain-containing protein [Candidatus Omnitrophota bacterium]HSA30934.1 DUF2905 domain-containing protein [Candidatus Omnitrophota bacterium]